MRRHLLGLGFLVAGVAALSAADKDTALAANTRAKKLVAKVTVDAKDQFLKEVFADVSKQLEDAGAGSLSVRYDLGVSMNQRVTFAAADTPLADALDGLLKKNGLGYVVISKQGDRYDGWLLIKQGNERGYAAGDEPKSKEAKPDPKTSAKEKEKEAPAAGEAAEKAASNKLTLALSLLKDGKTDKAKQRLKDIVDAYPNTKAAGEARKQLEKLNP
jgi:TolA-binding protein